MPKYYYTQSVLYTLVVEAATAEAADIIARDTDIAADTVVRDLTDWEQDGVEE